LPYPSSVVTSSGRGWQWQHQPSGDLCVNVNSVQGQLPDLPMASRGRSPRHQSAAGKFPLGAIGYDRKVGRCRGSWHPGAESVERCQLPGDVNDLHGCYIETNREIWSRQPLSAERRTGTEEFGCKPRWWIAWRKHAKNRSLVRNRSCRRRLHACRRHWSVSRRSIIFS